MVGILTFGLGMAAGIPTMLLSVYQGLPLGAFIGLHYNRDLTVDFLGWLAIHGVTELGALILFAAGGLVIAEKILFPGRYSRLENLALHGRLAAQMAVGAVLMLFVAAILEGGFRQLVAEHAAALRHRVRRRRAVARLFLLRRQGKARRAKGAATMTLIHERTSEFFEGGRRERRQIVTPEGVPVHGRARRSRRAADRLRARPVHLAPADARDLHPDHLGDRVERRQPDRDLDRAVHRLPRPQPLFRHLRARLAGLDPGQAPGRAARDRPRRRPADAGRHHRAQPHARGRDVHSAGHAVDLGKDRNRRA